MHATRHSDRATDGWSERGRGPREVDA